MLRVTSNNIRDEYQKLVKELDRPTYHLTVTYQNRPCFEKPTHQNKDFNMSSIFATFYLCRLLPYIMNTTKFTKDSIKHLQPISLVFPERHKDRFTLHHHAVISAHESTAHRLDLLLEKELIYMFPFKNVQSIYLTKRDDSIVQYASEDYQEFHDDVLVFAPRV
jgi:hypothetical protein